MARQRKIRLERQISIEICRSTLRMAIVSRAEDSDEADVQTRSMTWRDKSNTIYSDAGIAELSKALKTLVSEERLSGATVRLTLSGDFCVTRVLTGTADHVRRELSNLEDRSQLYLSLGPGEKALAGSIRQIDARHQHALLTVSNQKTLDALVQVAANAGVQIELVEPSLVALSRVVGDLGHDRDQPVLIVNATEKGAEVGICYEGRLLLDYRPGGRAVHSDVADIIVQHMARLKRYCFRYFRFAQGELGSIYLCGSDEYVEKARAGFARHEALQVEVLDLAELDADWRFAEPPSSSLAAAIGTCRLAADDETDRRGPNLMEDLDTQQRAPLARALLRTAWPIAAVLLVAAALSLLNQQQASSVADMKRQVSAFATTQTRYRGLHRRLIDTTEKTQHFERISGQLSRPSWSNLVRTIGGCMPNNVWLEALKVRDDGEISIVGASYSENGVYEFAGWLKKAPQLEDVAVESTQAGRFRTARTTKFQLECRLKTLANLNGGAGRDD